MTCIIYYKLSFWHPSFSYVDSSPLSLLNMKNLTYGNIFSHVTKEYSIYVDKIFKNMFATWIKYLKNISSNSLVRVHILATYCSPSHLVALLVYITHHMKNNTWFFSTSNFNAIKSFGKWLGSWRECKSKTISNNEWNAMRLSTSYKPWW